MLDGPALASFLEPALGRAAPLLPPRDEALPYDGVLQKFRERHPAQARFVRKAAALWHVLQTLPRLAPEYEGVLSLRAFARALAPQLTRLARAPPTAAPNTDDDDAQWRVLLALAGPPLWPLRMSVSVLSQSEERSVGSRVTQRCEAAGEAAAAVAPAAAAAATIVYPGHPPRLASDNRTKYKRPYTYIYMYIFCFVLYHNLLLYYLIATMC